MGTSITKNSLLAAKCVPTLVVDFGGLVADEDEDGEDALDDVDLDLEDAACAPGPALRKHAHG